MARRLVSEMLHYSPQAIFKPTFGLDPNAHRLPAPWERVKPVSQQYLLIAAYFDETWTRKVLADEKIGILAKKHLFNPQFEPIIRERIPNKFAFRLDWILKELADERSSFTMDPSDAEPEFNLHAETEMVKINAERKRSSAYIPITSQSFVELKRSLLRKIEKASPLSKVIGQKPEAWLRTWSNLPERPSNLFSFRTRGVPSHVLNDLEDIRLRLETIAPARVNGFKLICFKIQSVTEEHQETNIKYYPFKDCLDGYKSSSRV